MEHCLVGGFSPSEKYESQLGLLFPMYGKNVQNHQPVVHLTAPARFVHGGPETPTETFPLHPLHFGGGKMGFIISALNGASPDKLCLGNSYAISNPEHWGDPKTMGPMGFPMKYMGNLW